MHVMNNRAARLAAAASAVLLSLAASAPPAQAEAYTHSILHHFEGGAAEGSYPWGSLILDPQGNLYGATARGGVLQWGTVFKLDPSGNVTVLQAFGPPVPLASPKGLLMDASGNLYGTAAAGGPNNLGGVFRLAPSGAFSLLAKDVCARAALIMDNSGLLYGTDVGCYDSGGSVFKLDPSTGAFTILHPFAGGPGDGRKPAGSLLMDAAGNLYGTTRNGGPSDAGTVFKLEPTGNFTLLHSFEGVADGSSPESDLVMDTAGNLYGTASEGGSFGGGTLFRLDDSGNNFTVLRHLADHDGVYPLAGLVIDSGGNLYGTTNYGGAGGLGTVFQLDPSGNCTVLHSFNWDDGAGPRAGLLLDASGNLYGTTYQGGSRNGGTLFKLSRLTFTGAPTSAAYGSQFTVSATTDVHTTVLLSASGACSISGTTVTMTSGSGTCELTADWLADSNHTAAKATQSTVAAPAAMTVTADNQSRPYGAANPTLTVSADGLVLGDTAAAAFSSLPECATAAGAASTVGSYAIACTGGVAPNYTITAYYPGTLTVTPALTTVAVTAFKPDAPDSSPQYSDPVALTASISNWGLGGRVPATTATFWIGTQALEGATNLGACTLTNGACSITVPLLDPLVDGMPAQPPSGNFASGSHTVYAVFGGTMDTANFTFANPGSTALRIDNQIAAATYTGTLYASTSSASSTTATVILAATVRDPSALPTSDTSYDPHPGDIRNARVGFLDTDSGELIASPPVGLVNALDPKTGAATHKWSLTIPSCATPPCSTSFTIMTMVPRDRLGYYLSMPEYTIVEIVQPGSNSISGGGYLVLRSPAGLIAPGVGSKANFGFNVKFNKPGAKLQGRINTIVRSNGRAYQIKGNSMSSLAVKASASPATATFSGKASIQDITDPKKPIPVDGNATLEVAITDTGNPKTNTIGITVWNKNGGLWFSSNWNGARTVPQTLGGGNLAIR